MKTLLPFAALAAALLVGAPAAAQRADADGGELVVTYADLDLTSAQGIAALDRRLRSAVQAACGTPSDADPEGKNLIRSCRARTMETLAAQREHAIASARGSGETELAARSR